VSIFHSKERVFIRKISILSLRIIFVLVLNGKWAIGMPVPAGDEVRPIVAGPTGDATWEEDSSTSHRHDDNWQRPGIAYALQASAPRRGFTRVENNK
jgi:hypothetical protein